MKSFNYILKGGLILSYLFCLISCSSDKNHEMIFDNPDIVIKKGLKSIVNLKITNKSKKTITINNITTSCSCISLNKSELTIKSNDVKNITLEFYKDNIGSFQEQIYIITDMPKDHIIHTIDYEVIP